MNSNSSGNDHNGAAAGLLLFSEASSMRHKILGNFFKTTLCVLKKIYFRLIFTFFLVVTPAVADVDVAKGAFNDEEFKKAIELLERDLSNPSAAFDAHLYTGKSLLALGKPREAIAFLDKALVLDDKSAEAQYTWALAKGELAEQASVFSAFGHIKAARRAFEKVVSLDPNHLEGRRALVDFFAIAPGFVGGDKEQAMFEAEELLKLNREKGMLARASVYQAKGKNDDAMETYNQTLDEFPNSLGALYNRGLMYRDTKNYGAAFSDFEALIAASDNSGEQSLEARQLNRLGQYFYGSVASRSLQNVNRGIERLEAYLKVGRFDEPFRKGYAEYYLATLYFEKGDHKKAEQFVGDARNSSDNKSLKKLLRKFAKKMKKSRK